MRRPRESERERRIVTRDLDSLMRDEKDKGGGGKWGKKWNWKWKPNGKRVNSIKREWKEWEKRKREFRRWKKKKLCEGGKKLNARKKVWNSCCKREERIKCEMEGESSSRVKKGLKQKKKKQKNIYICIPDTQLLYLNTDTHTRKGKKISALCEFYVFIVLYKILKVRDFSDVYFFAAKIGEKRF